MARSTSSSAVGLAGILLLCVASTSSDAVQDELIRCPVTRITTEVTTRLPEPWWQTPQGGRLRTLRLEAVGGLQTLVCEFDANGVAVWLMRRAPEGSTCRLDDRVFRCSK